MKNRKGYISDAFIFLTIVIGFIGVLFLAMRTDEKYQVEKHRMEAVSCVQTLNLMPTLKDTVTFYHIQPNCVNVSPKDTLHG